MGLSVFKLLLILVIVFVIFGAGKLPQVMGDIGKGIRSLKEGLHGEDAAKAEASRIEAQKDTPPHV
jgi:sec-independent protein translocase protein TatA